MLGVAVGDDGVCNVDAVVAVLVEMAALEVLTMLVMAVSLLVVLSSD